MIIALCPRLPIELALEVSNTRSEIKMPVWEQRPSRIHLVIFLLSRFTTEELGKTQKTIQDAIPSIMEKAALVWEEEDMWEEEHMLEEEHMRDAMSFVPINSVELIPRDRHRLRTRRDL
ncbi:uncharacterized protein N7479_006456 [Penicillium vulpinum]|uniref:Uncharacterized protein n=1 Tax=Penicillium vulpinum TaxID=29845 RepID=A0A1V6S2P4_9EURO|nr:uncharacterized protein N7479_006456 [Penicillium vulpinum]KAJ5959306.1 hypothetical protein N7479_006456 [Penicillium vulpinum]OQE08148.1 hypothetical protein PENVUL_c011G00873 [Penicillium vulpinum]